MTKKKGSAKIPNPLKSDIINPPNTSDGEALNLNPSMEMNVTKFAKSNTNPEFELFEGLVDTIRKSVRVTVDHRKSINDSSPESIKKYTGETIKKHLRSSRWA